MKHFEKLWEEAESLTSSEEINISERLSIIQNLIPSLSTEENFGEFLYHICALSLKYNINTYSALLKTIQDKKIEILDPEHP